MMRLLAALGALALLSGCATMAGSRADHPEATVFAAEADAKTALAAALASAKGDDKLVLAVFGANWCHDSRALAGWLESDRFAPLRSRYDIVYIDVGSPQSGDGRNLELAAEYGVADIEGTPTLLVIDPATNTALNVDSAKSWRNAASRTGDAIYDMLSGYLSAEM